MTNTLKSAWLPLVLTAVAMLALVGWLAAVGTAGAAVSSLDAGDGTAEPGGTVSVDITAEASSPGIGAYEVQVAVGGTAVTSVTCTKSGNSAFDLAVCNANFDQDDGTVGPVFFTGASTSGATGTVTLGTITATCGSAGSSTLTVTVQKLSDPSAADISVSPGNGSITCAVATPVPTAAPTASPAPGSATAAPTASPTPKTLPKTGGTQGDSSSTDTTMLAVAAMGLVVVAGGAWAVARARREV